MRPVLQQVNISFSLLCFAASPSLNIVSDHSNKSRACVCVCVWILLSRLWLFEQLWFPRTPLCSLYESPGRVGLSVCVYMARAYSGIYFSLISHNALDTCAGVPGPGLGSY